MSGTWMFPSSHIDTASKFADLPESQRSDFAQYGVHAMPDLLPGQQGRGGGEVTVFTLVLEGRAASALVTA